jgi:vanillate O-demethylase monooxygenase subunit
MADGMLAIARAAFEEDRIMIEAQERVLKLTPNPQQIATVFDNALSQLRWIMDKLAKEEGQPVQ